MDRMGIAPSNRGPRDSGDRKSPYARPTRLSSDEPWKHDMFAKQHKIEGGELGARMAVAEKAGSTTLNTSLSLQKALAAVNGSSSASSKDIIIRGASGVTVEVRELVKGTTAEDVEAIFNRCGKVLYSKLVKTPRTDSETVHVKFENQDQAERAVSMFNKEKADGRFLEVEIINNGLTLKGAGGGNSIDALLEDGTSGGSKLRSDAIMATDTRAQVMTNPWGKTSNRGGRRGRGRGARGRGVKTGGMDID